MRPSVIVRPIAVNPHEIGPHKLGRGPHRGPWNPLTPKGINTVHMPVEVLSGAPVRRSLR
jgi:hypothetical protein